MSEMKIFPRKDWTEKDREKIDEFILRDSTNGEFINSIKYLDYHPEDRFADDSIAVIDAASGSIRCVVMASASQNENSVISHPGTTFAGPVINIRDGYKAIRTVLAMALDYYESKYAKVSFKTVPVHYGGQESGILDYLLLQNGYKYGMTALANVLQIGGLQKEEELLSLYDSKRRNHVRKPVKTGLFSFNRARWMDRKIWEHMNENLKQKFNSKTTHSYDEIVRLQQSLPERIVPYEVRTGDNEYAAFALVYKFKHVFHTQYLDVNYKFSGEYPNLYLVHKLLIEACREGYSMFSFGASTENGGKYLNEGLFAYKSGYGGGSIILPFYTKCTF